MFALLQKLHDETMTQSLWPLDLYSDCKSGNHHSTGEEGMSDCAEDVDNDTLDMTKAPYAIGRRSLHPTMFA
ncbi:hypothetical protein GUITHDRAFT_111734 [Guillardia theta CCMP2712]|uniref:Uncharacterized protein n=1 Tax=Guillardia theta (strain CCMP2712) TaxID=905079 RepID=L1J0X1_GUITC|nr:hypothetical protein GUITHDRAFT_111734 [Guillardia theta CCMP2712]EKX42166.1 hypothetical protein GUITHDRAFT_111734 [Guillardia theta CCMP2712]|eukprot:XP_005829146.1 hypothetical protein GUITHDRAFT_111734 [Guillardia theta CCMP2712]